MAEVVAVVGAAKKGIEAANGVLDLYNEMIDKVIPWETVDEALRALGANGDQFSKVAAALVGNIQTLLLNSSDQHKSSQEQVNRWCMTAAPVLNQCVLLFDHAKESNVAEAQRLMLLMVLNKGSESMSNAIEKLELSRESFDTAYSIVSTLKTQLELDSDENSDYFTKAVSKLRTNAYSGAAAGVIFGPIGLALSYSVAAGLVEGELIPQLKKALEETIQQFNHLREIVKEAKNSIELARNAITLELSALGSMSSQIETTKTFSDQWTATPEDMVDQLKTSITKLIDVCERYSAELLQQEAEPKHAAV